MGVPITVVTFPPIGIYTDITASICSTATSTRVPLFIRTDETGRLIASERLYILSDKAG